MTLNLEKLLLIKRLIMLNINLKKITLPLFFCAISALLTPVLAQAATETGSIAATKAADQKAALAKKAADRQRAAEEKKAAEAQKPAEAPKENAPVK
ncbi:MAG: hypothetical protein RLZ75_3102 [Pseudomonadota bacterium]